MATKVVLQRRLTGLGLGRNFIQSILGRGNVSHKSIEAVCADGFRQRIAGCRKIGGCLRSGIDADTILSDHAFGHGFFGLGI